MIWVDLDNTLIYSPDALDRLADRVAGTRTDVHIQPLEKVLVGRVPRPACVRPGAFEFLAALRELTRVRMLTTASRAYAEAMNAHFRLGFEPDAIVAREDWMEFPPPFTQMYRPRNLNVDSHLLIDDDGESIHCRMKLAYLGSVNLVIVSRFLGLEDSGGEYSRYLTEIAAKLPGHTAH